MGTDKGSSQTKLAVLTETVSNLRDDVKEVKSMVADKIATKEYVDDKINPLRKLVYWMLGLVGAVFTGSLLAIVGWALTR